MIVYVQFRNRGGTPLAQLELPYKTTYHKGTIFKRIDVANMEETKLLFRPPL